MRHTAAPPTTTQRDPGVRPPRARQSRARLPRIFTPWILAAVLLAAVAAIVVAVALQPTGTSTPSFGGITLPATGRDSSTGDDATTMDGDGVVSEYDGTLPSGVTPFNDEFPAVANLDPELLEVLRSAASDAADDGVTFFVNSGWRSPEYQLQLLREAVDEYGSVEEAGRWVATPETSAHVSGDAVDIGLWAATSWLSEHGAEYGLCQTYVNEPWHFELNPNGAGRRCPRMFADPTEDPRMQ